MNDSSLLRLDRQVCFALYAASRAVTQAYVPLLAPLGLTYPQYLVMLALWEEDGLPVGHIGGRLELDSGTLTPLLKRLEAAKLVRRKRDSADERVVRIHLTPAGQALKERAVGIPEALACRLGAKKAELARLREGLLELTRTLRADSVAETK